MLTVLPGKKIQNLSVIDKVKIEETVRSSLITQTISDLRNKLIDRVVDDVTSQFNSIQIHLNGDIVLFFGAVYGKILYHSPEQSPPKHKCFNIDFSDKSCLSVTVNLFGSIKAMTKEESEEQYPDYLLGALDPSSDDFTWDAFHEVIDSRPEVPKLSVKKFVTSCLPTYIGGIGNGYLQEILYRAKIHPKRKMASLNNDEQRRYHKSIKGVVRKAIKLGGRTTERNLFGSFGRFVSSLRKDTVGMPCSTCGATIIKFPFEGGSCYVCPVCQKL